MKTPSAFPVLLVSITIKEKVLYNLGNGCKLDNTIRFIKCCIPIW